MAVTGSCLCGDVKIKLEDNDLPKAITLCHCTDCQHSSGSFFSSNILVPIKDVNFEGNVGSYDSKAGSGKTVTRKFCPRCNSWLSHASPAFGDKMAIQTGNLPSYKGAKVEAELFVKDRVAGIKAVEGAGQVDAMP